MLSVCMLIGFGKSLELFIVVLHLVIREAGQDRYGSVIMGREFLSDARYNNR